MDVAALALNIDSTSVVKATADLDKFSAASDRAKSTSGSQASSIARLVASVQSMDAKLSVIVGSLEKIANIQRAVSAANDNTAASTARVGAATAAADAHIVAYTQHLAAQLATQKSVNAAMMQADAHVTAWQNALRSQSSATQESNAHVLAYRNSLGQVEEGAKKASTAIKFTAHDSLNASRQLADIGVTAASGMSPFLIAVQQGPQLLDILQNKAAETGKSLGTVFRAAAAAVLAAAAPFAPLIALLVLAAAGIAALTKQANDDSGLKKYTTAMGYTKEEVKKLNAVSVTFGDTAKAVFQVGWERIASSFGITTAEMGKKWQSVMDWMVTILRASLAGIYAAFTGAQNIIPRLIDNIKTGKKESLLEIIGGSYADQYKKAQTFMDDVVKKATGNARKRQSDMAKAMYDKPSAGSGSVKKSPLTGILQAAQDEINTEKARGAAVGLSARAAAELEQRTKLLNQIQKAGITITDSLRAKVGALAQAYADAKVDADVSTAIAKTTDEIDRQQLAVADQIKLIGLYGPALARATREMEAQQRLRDSLPKGEIVASSNLTGGLSDDIDAADRATRMEKIRKDAADSAYAMDLERKGLALTGAAAISYAFTVDRLNEAKRAGIELSPAEVAAIKAAGDAYGGQRYAIDQQAQAMADSREITRGFFSDFINGARESGNVFKSFADSAINSLNRVIEKLLDKTLTGFFDSAGSGGGGFLARLLGGGSSPKADPFASAGSYNFSPVKFNALGGVYGAQRFANGGAFTNTVVNTPTLFRFAKGAKMGEMGEAGPEAIMPLTRGPNGKLGVQSHGGGKPSIRMGDIYTTNSFAGAVGLDGIAAMVRQGGEATYNQVKRDLQTLLEQLDTDGAFAS